MRIIEKHVGCGVGKQYCWGPADPYYTIFSSELRHLGNHLIGAVLLGLAVLLVLFLLKQRNKLSLSVFLIAAISLAVFVGSFFTLAYFFPAIVLY